MPILYSNTVKPMKTYLDVTQEELDSMRKHHKQYRYTDQEAAEVFNLVRMYVDSHQATCMSCHTNLRDAKTKLNDFFVNNEQKIVDKLAEEEAKLKAIAYTEDVEIVFDVENITATQIIEPSKELEPLDQFVKLCSCGGIIHDKRRKQCNECLNK